MSPRPLSEVQTQFLGHLDIEAKLGEGAMGEVYRVRREGKVYALKVLMPGTLASADALSRFLLEGRILKTLDHPNVLKVHEIGEDPDCPYLLCDLVDGEGLDQVVATQAPLPWGRALELLEALLGGLAQAHSKGIIHRDIKPSNVLMDRQGHLRLADFGIAKAAAMDSHKTSTGMVMGTPAYIAPELVVGVKASPAADIYSVGVVFYELLTGRLPFEDDEVSTLLSRKLSAQAVPLPSRRVEGVPPPIDRLVQMSMAREPGERLPTAAAFLREISDVRKILTSAKTQATTGLRVRSTAVVPAMRPDSRAVSVPDGSSWPFPFPFPLSLGIAVTAMLVVGTVWFRPRPVLAPLRTVETARVQTPPPLSAQEAALRDVLVESLATSGELDERLASVTALAPDRAALVLDQAWRRTSDALKSRIGEALATVQDVCAVPALVEILSTDPSGSDTRRVEAAGRLSLLVSGASPAADAQACAEPEVIVSRLCTLLKKTCLPGRGERAEVVRAALRCLGWLGHPATTCVQDIVAAPGCAAWLGNGLGDDPAQEARATLTRIDTTAARTQLGVLPELPGEQPEGASPHAR